MAINHTMNRRQFMLTTSVVGGAFVLGFVLPSRQGEAGVIAENPWM
jgi:Flp pilus assembly protein protease CpaA